MLTLCGFAASNYYNKVKLVLLEKGIPFEEKLQWLDGSAELRAKSPLGKVPFFEIGGQTLCESQVMVDYIEAAYPHNPLIPADAFAAAKVRELITFMELHLELVARNLYAEAFFGGKVSDGTKEKTQQQLEKSVHAFGRLAKFSPYIAGSDFTLADCAAAVHLPLVSSATRIIYGQDLLADLPAKDYLKRLGERPSVQQVNADRKANTEALMARTKG